MVTNYEYEDYFYTGSHHKYLLFVDQDCDVTPVEGGPPQITKASGTPIIITNDNILKERFELQENFNSSENWAFGSVEPSMVTFDIREDGSVPYLADSTLFRLYMYFDGDSSTLLYIGTYYFDTDELSDDSKSRTISGFDMIQLIRDIDVIDWYRSLFNAHEEPDPEDPEQTIWVPAREKITVKEARDSLFRLFNTEGLPITQQAVTLPNDDFEFAFDVDTEALSGGQILEDLCEINGRYGHLGRKLVTVLAFRNIQIFEYISPLRYDEAGEEIGNDLRIHGMKKGLYETASIGRLRVYNRDDVMLAKYDDGWKKHFSVYCIYDNILIDNITKSKTSKSALKAMMKNIYDSIRYRKYVPFEAKFPADLCREAGDRITLWADIDLQDSETKSYKTIIFKRRITGIQNMVDTYSAEGDKKLPGFGDYSTSGGYSAKRSLSGGSGSSMTEGSDGSVTKDMMSIEDYIEIVRNDGRRFLDEPTDVVLDYDGSVPKVSLNWKDPEDITDYKPIPLEWEGTVVVRREDRPPKHIWDGTIVETSTTRDEYEETALEDTDIEYNKTYFYGIFPYCKILDDNDHPLYRYRFTKSISVDTTRELTPPTLQVASVEGTEVTIAYIIPVLDSGEYEVIKLVGKKDGIPLSITDGDVSQDLTVGSTIINAVTVTGLDEETQYYWVIFIEDDSENTANSEPVSCTTGVDLGWNYDYTGAIQTFTAPKTGIYSLETWGAQGGDATDGTNTARGGYGAYAYGEVLLQQGETIYINVGGQNGYGGGGNYDYNEYMVVEPDANGYILNAEATSDGFYDSVSQRKMKVLDGNFDNFTYDSTNNWITFGSGCNSLFGFLTKIPEDLLINASAIDFELEGEWTQACSTTDVKYLGLIKLTSDREQLPDTFTNIFVRGNMGATANAVTIVNSTISNQIIFDYNCVIYDGAYDHWKNKEEVITYHFDFNTNITNGTIRYSSQHCTQGVGAGTRIRDNGSAYALSVTSGKYLEIKCGTLQGFNARAYRIKITLASN